MCLSPTLGADPSVLVCWWSYPVLLGAPVTMPAVPRYWIQVMHALESAVHYEVAVSGCVHLVVHPAFCSGPYTLLE